MNISAQDSSFPEGIPVHFQEATPVFPLLGYCHVALTLYTLTSVAYSLYCSRYISEGADKENLLNNQELL